MALTTIANLFTPAVWSRLPAATREQFSKLPTLFASPVVVKSPEFDGYASGPGTTINVPFFKDITDASDSIQIEDTAPSTDNITAGVQVAPILNRVSPNGASALSAAVSGTDPVGAIALQLAVKRAKQRQATLVSTIRGAFGTALSSMSLNAFVEAENQQVAGNHFITRDRFLDAIKALGELKAMLEMGGAIWTHPDIETALNKLDHENITTIRDADGRVILKTYQGIPLYLSDDLVRNGTTSGKVYDTYVFGPSSLAYGEKPQSGDTLDVASLQLDFDKSKNNAVLYDRSRFLMHLAGTKWIGTPAGQSATNTELANKDNWELVFSSAKRCGVVRLQTNG